MFLSLVRMLIIPALLLASLPALAQEDISSVVQEQYDDYMFPAPPNYGITGQTRVVTSIPIAIREGENGPITETSVTGNVVETYYLYLREDENHLDRIQLVNHYEKAIRSYQPETLFRDEYNYYGRFSRDDKQYYMVINVASKGAEYAIIIVEALL